MKTHYDLLAIERTAPPDEVKRAFRREIARYHPDKVQHLGPEFQEIAATRAAELTEAYRVLMDVALRKEYDESLAGGPATPAPHPPPAYQPPPSEPATAGGRPPDPIPEAPPVTPREAKYSQERATTVEFLRRAVLAKFNEAVDTFGGERLKKPGFDAAYKIKGRKGLFSKADPPVTVLMRVVPTVDAEAVNDAWMPAFRAGGASTETLCLLLLGNGVAPAKELSVAVSEQRRRARQIGPVVVPVDMRDWDALFPPDTPTIVRSLLERLRSGR